MDNHFANCHCGLIISMSSSHSSRSISIPLNRFEDDSSALEQFIVLSDSSPQPEQMLAQAFEQEGVNEQIVELVHPRYLNEDQEERKKQEKIIQNAQEMYKSLEEKERQEANLKREMMAKKASKEQTRKLEQQIKKQFPAYQHLTVMALSRVKARMGGFDRVCKMEETHRDLKQFRKVRQQNREKLTQALMLTIEELRERVKTEEYAEREYDLIEEHTNILLYCYEIASKIERTFFKLLVRKFGQLQTYQNQLTITLRQFKDKNNIEFRRGILNSNLDLQYLATAKEEDLKCQKPKEEELAELQSYIRQNEKEMRQEREVEEEADLERINSMNYMRSEFGDEQARGQGEGETTQRANHELILKCRERYQRLDQKMKQFDLQRQERTRSLLQQYEHNSFFMKVCLKYKIC